MHYATLASGGDTAKPRDDRLGILVAGDNGQANSIVSELIEELGFTAVHTGGLADGGRRQHPGSPVYAVKHDRRPGLPSPRLSRMPSPCAHHRFEPAPGSSYTQPKEQP
jgi:hypothetical protein